MGSISARGQQHEGAATRGREQHEGGSSTWGGGSMRAGGILLGRRHTHLSDSTAFSSTLALSAECARPNCCLQSSSRSAMPV